MFFLDEAQEVCGIINNLIADAEIRDLMINKYDEVWIEKNGILTRMKDPIFTSDFDFSYFLLYFIHKYGTSFHSIQNIKYLDYRIHIVLPPVAIKSPCFTLRKLIS